MSQGRHKHAAAVVGARLYVCGGWSDGGALESAECFDTLTYTWQSLPPLGHPSCSEGTAVTRKHVHMVGGDDNRALQSSQTGFTFVVALVERFDPEIGLLQPMFEERIDPAVTVLHGQLYMSGGEVDNDVPVSSVERFDPTEN